MLYLAVILPFIVNFLPIENKKIKVLIAIAPAIYIILFRFGLGTDYFSYEFLYNSQNITSIEETLKPQAYDMEKGFKLIIYFFRRLNISFQGFVSSMSLIIYLFFVKWIADNEEDLFAQITLFNGMFFVVWVLSGLRQGLVMSIGTYLFLSKESKLKLWQSLFVIFLLSQIHISAFYYLFLILAQRFNFKKSRLVLLLALSLVFSTIPLVGILENFDNIAIVNKIINMSSRTVGFWDFSGLIRLSFAALLILFYDVLSKKAYIKELTDLSLIGFSVYFFLKFSENDAARIHTFTFLLIIPIFAYLYNNIKQKEKIGKYLGLAIFAFSLVFIQKDLLTHQQQVEAKNPNFIYQFKNYFNKENKSYREYNSYYPFITLATKKCDNKLEVSKNIDANNVKEGIHIVYNKDLKKYGIINEKGKWESEKFFVKKPELFKNLLLFKNYGANDTPLDFSLEKAPYLGEKIKKARDLQLQIDEETAKIIEIENDQYDTELQDLFIDTSKIFKSEILMFELPFQYKQLKINYDNKRTYYLMLDKNDNIDKEILLTRPIKFDKNNLAEVSSVCSNFVINSNNDIVWVNEK